MSCLRRVLVSVIAMLIFTLTGASELSAQGFAAPAPTFNRRAGLLQVGAQVQITDAASGATIFYTADGSIPATDGSNPATLVSPSPVTVVVSNVGTTVINAIATSPLNSASPMASASYTLLPLGYQEIIPTATVGSSSVATVTVYLNQNQALLSASVGTSPAAPVEYISSPGGCSPSLSGTACTYSVLFTPAYPGIRNGSSWFDPAAVWERDFELLYIDGSWAGAVGPGRAGADEHDPGQWNPGADDEHAGRAGAQRHGLPGHRRPCGECDSKYIPGNPAHVATVGTGTPGYVDGATTVAQFRSPQGVAVAGNTDVYIADTGNNVIRQQQNSTRMVTTYAGTALRGAVGTAARRHRRPSTPRARSSWTSQGTSTSQIGQQRYSYGRTRRQHPHLCGRRHYSVRHGHFSGWRWLRGSAGCFNAPTAMAMDAASNLFVLDSGNKVVREITTGSATGGAS